MRFIVIEGLDGCGKGTQTNLLVDYLKSTGKRVLVLDYPCYGKKGCSLVEMYLHGEIADNAEKVNSYAASMFYAADRYIDSMNGNLAKLKIEDYDFIIANRYTTSNAIFQCTKLNRDKWDSFCDWLFDFEYNLLELPRPTDVIYLEIPLEISQKLMTERYAGDEKKKDLHESDLHFMQKVRGAGDYLKVKYNWISIDCTVNNTLMSRDEIHSIIKTKLNV